MRFLIAATTLFCGLVMSYGQTICIDPGHPSENGGTTGKKITETRANWEVAVRLRDILKSKGVKVVMTKQSEKEKVVNKRRAEIANECKADLMIRLHCDANDGRGFAVYYPTVKGTSQGGSQIDRANSQVLL